LHPQILTGAIPSWELEGDLGYGIRSMLPGKKQMTKDAIVQGISSLPSANETLSGCFSGAMSRKIRLDFPTELLFSRITFWRRKGSVGVGKYEYQQQ